MFKLLFVETLTEDEGNQKFLKTLFLLHHQSMYDKEANREEGKDRVQMTLFASLETQFSNSVLLYVC